MANGLAGNPLISDPASNSFSEFQSGLSEAMVLLAREIARDGEGATKFVTITVKGAKTHKDAQEVIYRSNTVNRVIRAMNIVTLVKVLIHIQMVRR